MNELVWTTALAGMMSLSLSGCASSPPPNDDVSVTETTQDGNAKADASDLPPAESTKVLALIDNVCGDSWCEGDFEWQFKKIVCSAAQQTCTLTTLVTRPATDSAPSASFWRSCKMAKVWQFSQMVETAANGSKFIAPTFYDKVDACATRIEDSIPSGG